LQAGAECEEREERVHQPTTCTRIEFVVPLTPSGAPKTMTTRSPGDARPFAMRSPVTQSTSASVSLSGGSSRGITPHKSAIRRRVWALGENATIGTGGRASDTLVADAPLSVNATRYLAPISRAVFTAPRAIASATLVARVAYGAGSKNGLFSASSAIAVIMLAASTG